MSGDYNSSAHEGVPCGSNACGVLDIDCCQAKHLFDNALFDHYVLNRIIRDVLFLLRDYVLKNVNVFGEKSKFKIAAPYLVVDYEEDGIDDGDYDGVHENSGRVPSKTVRKACAAAFSGREGYVQDYGYKNERREYAVDYGFCIPAGLYRKSFVRYRLAE